jgi:uncharacterized SAM-binding protein YcdF (DUF218 family)
VTARRTEPRRWRLVGGAALGVLALAALTPLPKWLAARYAERPGLAPAHAIVVLGGGFGANGLGDASLRRLVHGVQLQREGLAPLLVLCGEAPRHGPSEAEVRAGLARAMGVLPGAIVTLAGASTTREEAVQAAAALGPRGVRSVLLVSGSLHLVRARGAFERAGFEVRPAPADTSFSHASEAAERLAAARALTRELAGWLYYRLAGYL